jgi:hypothetical protein
LICFKGLIKTLEIGTSVKRIAFQNPIDESATFSGVIDLSKKNESVCYNYSFYLRVKYLNAVLYNFGITIFYSRKM